LVDWLFIIYNSNFWVISEFFIAETIDFIAFALFLIPYSLFLLRSSFCYKMFMVGGMITKCYQVDNQATGSLAPGFIGGSNLTFKMG
jgi:hypothetical protein